MQLLLDYNQTSCPPWVYAIRNFQANFFNIEKKKRNSVVCSSVKVVLREELF